MSTKVFLHARLIALLFVLFLSGCFVSSENSVSVSDFPLIVSKIGGETGSDSSSDGETTGVGGTGGETSGETTSDGSGETSGGDDDSGTDGAVSDPGVFDVSIDVPEKTNENPIPVAISFSKDDLEISIKDEAKLVNELSNWFLVSGIVPSALTISGSGGNWIVEVEVADSLANFGIEIAADMIESSNGEFNGEAAALVSLDTVQPSVQINCVEGGSVGVCSSGYQASRTFQLAFSESVVGIDESKILVNGQPYSGTPVVGDESVYTFDANLPNSSAPVVIRIEEGAAEDFIGGNQNLASQILIDNEQKISIVTDVFIPGVVSPAETTIPIHVLFDEPVEVHISDENHRPLIHLNVGDEAELVSGNSNGTHELIFHLKKKWYQGTFDESSLDYIGLNFIGSIDPNGSQILNKASDLPAILDLPGILLHDETGVTPGQPHILKVSTPIFNWNFDDIDSTISSSHKKVNLGNVQFSKGRVMSGAKYIDLDSSQGNFVGIFDVTGAEPVSEFMETNGGKFYGVSTAIYGEVALVGSYSTDSLMKNLTSEYGCYSVGPDTPNDPDSGYVEILKRTGDGNWQIVKTVVPVVGWFPDKPSNLTDSGVNNWNYCTWGRSVAIDASHIAVGTRGGIVVYPYVENSVGGVSLGSGAVIVHPTPWQNKDYIPEVFSIQNGTLAVLHKYGQIQELNFYIETESGWEIQQTFEFDEAAFTLDMDEDGNALVGTYLKDVNGMNAAGSAVYFKRTSVSSWKSQAIDPAAPKVNDYFGFNVAISKDMAVISGNQPDSFTSGYAETYFYSKSANGDLVLMDIETVSSLNDMSSIDIWNEQLVMGKHQSETNKRLILYK